MSHQDENLGALHQHAQEAIAGLRGRLTISEKSAVDARKDAVHWMKACQEATSDLGEAQEELESAQKNVSRLVSDLHDSSMDYLKAKDRAEKAEFQGFIVCLIVILLSMLILARPFQ